MDARVQHPEDPSIGDLFGQLVDDSKATVRAEIGLYKRIALYRVGKAKAGLIALAAGGLLAFCGLVAFLVGLVLGLAPLVGPVAGGLIVLLASAAAGYFLIRYGAARLTALSGDADEKAALAAGERLV